MRFFVMVVTAVGVLFLIKLRWPKKKNFYKHDQYNLQTKGQMPADKRFSKGT